MFIHKSKSIASCMCGFVFLTQLLESPSTNRKKERKKEGNIAVWDSDMVIWKPCFLRVNRFNQPYHRYHGSKYFKQGQHSCGKNPWKKIHENSVSPLSGKKKRFISGAFPIFPPTQWHKKIPPKQVPWASTQDLAYPAKKEGYLCS